jgi:hypothetical protein
MKKQKKKKNLEKYGTSSWSSIYHLEFTQQPLKTLSGAQIDLEFIS